MEKLWICVYRDTIEEHDESNNLTEVLTTKDIVESYVNEFQSDCFDNVEEFLNEYTADNTMDFYDYAMKHNAVIATENW